MDMCILMGTDFNEGVSGIGPKKGLKLIRELGDLEHVLSHIDKDIPDYDTVRSIFLDKKYSDEYAVKPLRIDRESVVGMLTEYDFSEDRINGTLDRIECARNEECARRKQRSLDGWL